MPVWYTQGHRVCKQNSAGQSTCETTLRRGGTILNQQVTGSVSVQSDCTGNSSFAPRINGQPAPDLHLRFFVLEGGKQMKALATDPGTVLKCGKNRLSVN